MSEIRVRKTDVATRNALESLGLHPLMAQLFAARGITANQSLKSSLADLLPPGQMLGIDDAALTLADALESGSRIVVVGDYDCDGATATAVAVRGMRMMLQAMGATAEQAAYHIDFIVPDRFVHGYGLSPEIVELAAEREPDLLVTVDNGIASLKGVERANDLGIGVVITDHHLPAETLPDALAIVNPNQQGCPFPSKNIAGVGVMFYVLMALRTELRERGAFDVKTQPRLDKLLDLVALGTVADVVKLDDNNRLLVAEGLRRIRAGAFQPAIGALFDVADKSARKATATDLGFIIGPRLNAAGRLADMSLGIKALLTDDPGVALEMARNLHQINKERQKIEGGMKEEALMRLEDFDPKDSRSLVVSDPQWHQGVVGLLASRLKDKYFLPTIAFAPGVNGEWKGSGRSIPGIHLRDVLDLVVKRLPEGAVPKFGGHAMAAGLTVATDALAGFSETFEAVVRELSDEAVFARYTETDGSLPTGYCNASTVDMLAEAVWGQGFPPPLFADDFEVLGQRLVKEVHSKLNLRRDGQNFTALRWNSTEPLHGTIRAAYRVQRDDFTGGDAIQLVIEQVAR
ncbi:MAG: single-stranded-DNA-specific exonuclease RecJ [Burkholderiales bacterium]|nr:single-stranded-DNA-specific exonuclease RecJ [Burkholderiales bacterium]